MKRNVLLSAAVLAVLVMFSACSLFPAKTADQTPKYVFLFIGDGMGKPHVELARQIFGKLNMDKLPVRGSVSTVNAERGVTDSAASGTAFACGVKTRNGRLGIDAAGNPVDSCAVAAKKAGRSAAILTTVGLNNATPAAFYGHVMSRKETKKLLEQFPASQIDILVGTRIDGMNSKVKQSDFLSGKAYLSGGSQGSADDLKGKGIRVIAKDAAPFFALKKLDGPVLLYSKEAGVLAKSVGKSIELLKDSPNGFFMMAEGGHIDHGGHGNNGQYMLQELQDFDRAVGIALEFYQAHPEETLIVVSADHHTGGLTLTGKVPASYFDQTAAKMKISRKDPADVIEKKLAANGIVCSAAEKKLIETARKQKGSKSLDEALRRICDAHAGISWKTRGHTADEVYLFAVGKRSERFAGKQENSDVGAKLKAIFQGK